MALSRKREQLLREGRVAEAERACERVLEKSPDDRRGAQRLWRSRRCATARPARSRDARAGGAGRSAGRRSRSTTSAAPTRRSVTCQRRRHGTRERACVCGPIIHVARSALGALLEARGDTRARSCTSRARSRMRREGRWLDTATTPQGAAAPGRACGAHRAPRTPRAVLYGLLEPLAKYGRDSLARVERACAFYLRRSRPSIRIRASSRRSCTSRGCPPRRISIARCFRGSRRLRGADRRDPRGTAGPAAIGRRARARIHERRARAAEPARRRRLRSWNGYYFYRHGERREDNCSRCPQTAAAIDALPLSRVPEHGPEVLFSVFTPGTQLLPHRASPIRAASDTCR